MSFEFKICVRPLFILSKVTLFAVTASVMLVLVNLWLGARQRGGDMLLVATTNVYGENLVEVLLFAVLCVAMVILAAVHMVQFGRVLEEAVISDE